LALAGRGHLVVLAAALAVVAGRRVATGTIAVVAVAVAVRWGSTSLEAVGGAQAVLGPAALTGPVAGGLSSLLGALALVLVAPGGNLRAASVGAAAGLLAAGPGGTGGIAVRVASTVVFVVLCLLARHLPGWRLPLALGVGAVALGLAGAAT